jgi:serralysin
MPTPYTASNATFLKDLAEDPYVEALLLGDKWGGPVGTGTSLTYSFPTAPAVPGLWSTASEAQGGYGPPGGATEPYSPTFATLTPILQVNVTKALEAWASLANIKFQLVEESSQEVGDIRIAITSAEAILGKPASGFAKGPRPYPDAGDIWLDLPSKTTNLVNPVAGTGGFMTLLHETGHALGLKHPFEGQYQLPDEVDRYSQTVMSYSRTSGEYEHSGVSSAYPTTPMLLDVLAIQHLYGANMSYRTGDETYTFNEGESYYQTIWDAGGIDTVAWTGSSGRTIDLRPGEFSNLGNPIAVAPGITQNGTVVIAYGAVIENARGGSGDDILVGNSAINHIAGGAGADTIYSLQGDDVIDGGVGHDRVIMDGKFASHEITDFGHYGILSHGPEDRELLLNVEVMDFTDRVVTIADGDPLFDTLFYLQTSPDIFATGIDARAHFQAAGWREGRDPSAWFDTDGYLAAYRDVHAAGIDPLEHYRTWGWREERDPSAAFDTGSYLAAHADVRTADINPLEHYLNFGRAEGRPIFGDDNWI